MNINKTIATVLLFSFLNINFSFLPVYSVEKTKKTKLIKSKVSEYRFDYVNTDWWKNFNDEYLNEYIYKAIENNYDLKVATLKVEQYNQMAKMQLASELPQATVGFAPSVNKFPMATSTSGHLAFPVIMSYEADIFLKNRDKTRSARKEWEKSKLDERAAYISISSAVGSTYFNIVKLDKIIELQKDIINSRKEIYDLMNERNKVGLTSTADLVRADKAYVSSKADLLDLEKDRNSLLNTLAVLIGESPNNIKDLKRAKYDDSYYVKIPESIPSEVIDQRPDYLIAEKMVEKAGIDVRVAKKEFLPSINLFGVMGFGSNALNSAFNWSNLLAIWGGSAMLNLFAGGKKIANLKLKKNLYEQTLHNYYNTNLNAIKEVNDSLYSLKQDDKKFKTNLNVYKLESKEYGFSQDKYNEGVISKLDLLQKHENLLALNKLVVQNKMDCNISYIGLYKATGTKL